MKTKFTPAPWKLEDINNPEYSSIIDSNKQLVISGEYDGYVCPFNCREDNEAKANAYLVSTAPELYNILQEAINEEETYNYDERFYGKWIEKAKLVLAKARGK